MTQTFDPKCYDLACHFLDDCKGVTEAMRNELIEDWLEDREQSTEGAAYDKYIDSKIDERRIEGKQAAFDRD